MRTEVETEEKTRDARKNLKHEKKVEKYEIQAQYFHGNVTGLSIFMMISVGTF